MAAGAAVGIIVIGVVVSAVAVVVIVRAVYRALGIVWRTVKLVTIPVAV